MATLVAGTIVRAGLNLETLDVAAAGGGDDFVNTGNEALYFNNTDVASRTVTLVTAATVDGLAVADRAVVVPALSRMLIGPFPTDIYNNPADSKLSMTYSAVTNLTVAVVKMGSL